MLLKSILSYPILLFMLVIFSFNGFSQSQFYLSEVWDMDGGIMPIFYKNASTTDDQRNVYVVGSTNNGSNGNDILIQKFNKFGDLLWEQSFDGDANAEDIGADIFVDASYNVYVTGGATQTTQNNLDLVVLKYNSSGVLQWSYFYNFGGSPIPYDGGTAITGDNNGSIYVTGTSAGTNTLTDFVTIKLNPSNGAQVWTSRYDYAQLNEVPSKIRVSGSSIIVTGGSQATQTPNIKWELATVRYNSSNGNQVGLSRTGGNSSSGIDEANDLTIDNNGNVYVVGATNNQNTGYDITILKFNDDLQLLWQQSFNGHGLEDKGYGIKTDAQGNVYAVGYVTNPNQGKNYSILKYNSSGTLQWSREFNGLANQDDEAVQLVVRGDRIFVTGAAKNGSYSDIVTMGYTADGQIFSVKSFESQFGLNDKPTAMGIDLDNNLIVVGQTTDTTGNFRNVTFKYNVFERPIDIVFMDSIPSHVANNIIIRFDRSAMNYLAIDKVNFTAGELKDFVLPNVIDSLNSELSFDAGRLTTFKLFNNLKTTDTLSISRLGDTISVPDFWATLVVEIPSGYDEQDISLSLNSIKTFVQYSELDYIYTLQSTPNDPYYSIPPSSTPYIQAGQTGLLNSDDNQAGINVENAWGVYNQHGMNYIRVGVYDTGISWEHEDFGDGTPQGTKVEGGYDYFNGVPIFNQIQNTHDIHGHGTAVAGIIGAIRNNDIGIAGIAGGDYLTGNYGVTLISMKIAEKEQDNTVAVFIPNSQIVNALLSGAKFFENEGYNLNVLNLSYGGTGQSTTMRNVLHFAFKNSCIIVAASGNYKAQSIQPNPTALIYPASYRDNWILKTGGSDFVPFRWNSFEDIPEGSVYGNNLDFIAPATPDLYRTLDFFNNSTYSYYGFGTSFAAPHVSGVASLMLSQHHPYTNSQYPNLLAPEDIETILKMTCTPVLSDWFITGGGTLPQPNDYNGYGLINAEAALESISLPYRVEHYNYAIDLSESTVQLVLTDHPITLPEGISGTNNNLTVGQKYADVYMVEITFNHNCPNQVLSAWVRNSSSNLFGLENIITNPHWSNVELVSYNQQTATLRGYLYNVKLTSSVNVWLPFDLNSTAQMAFSLWTLDADPNVGINEFENNLIVVYPNPAFNFLTIRFDKESSSHTDQIVILDATGRIFQYYKSDDYQPNDEFKIDLTGYPSGFYHIQIHQNGSVINKKVIIQKK